MGEVVLGCTGSCIVKIAGTFLSLWLFMYGISLIARCPEVFFEAHRMVFRKVVIELIPCFLKNHKKLVVGILFFVVLTTGVVLAKF